MTMNRGNIRKLRTATLAGAAAIAIISASAPAMAQTGGAGQVNVPAQSMSGALNRLGRQTNSEIVFAPAAVRGLRAPSLQGRFTVDEALERLLAGSGLRFRRTGQGAIVVEPGSGEARAAGAAAESESADQAGVAEILVVGSRSQNVDIARSEDDAQPYVVFRRDEIQRSQATNLEEFFRTRLPMNTQQGSTATGGGPTGLDVVELGNSSQINLRGLGTAQTLILVDGRRQPRLFSNATDFTQADINGIPLSSIERIEVLPSTAGGIYGGGALGGVINIVRRRDYHGIELRASYQGTFRGGGESWQFDVTGGFSPDGGRTQISFSGSYADARPLYAEDNDLAQRGRLLTYRNDPGQNLLRGATPNIRATTNLVLDNGTPLNSRIVYIPSGYPGVIAAGDGGRALLANAGQFNLDLSNDTQGRFASLRAEPRVRSVNLNLRRELFSRLDAFADFTYSDNVSRSSYSGVGSAYTINANAPNNPFQQAISVTFPLTGTEDTARVAVGTLSASAGLIYRPSRTWSATLEYGFSRVRVETDSRLQPLQGAISSAIRIGTIDVLRDLNQYPIDLTPYLGIRLDASPFETRQQNLSLRVSGTIVDLPGGPLAFSSLLEHRDEVAAAIRFPAGDTYSYQPERSQANDAGYAELLVPIFSERNALPGLRALELQLSVRHDRYRTRSTNPVSIDGIATGSPPPAFAEVENGFSSTDYTLAARWSPVRDIVLRASYGTGFLPASISQLVGQDNPFLVNGSTLVDPRRGNTTSATLRYNIRTGGNPDLLPEQSTSLSAGVIVTPSFIPRLRLSADYTSIRKRNEIVGPRDQDIVSNEDLFPGRVRRGPNLPGDQPGWAGPIIFIDRTLTNFARAQVRSLDFQGDFEFSPGPLGTLRVYALATRQLRLRRQFLTTTSLYDLVGFFDGPLRWRGNVGIDWSHGGWRAGWNMQYYSSYSVLYGDPAQALIGTSQRTRQGTDRIPSQAYHDVFVAYDFPAAHPLAGTRMSLGVQNLLDHRPPVLANPLLGYSRYGDPRLRRFTLSIAKSF